MKKTLWLDTLKLWAFGLVKIPLVFWLRPRVIEVNDQQAILRIPFVRRTKNHVHSMYFGALCSGADIVGGLHVMHFFNNRLDQYSFVFKDVHAEFIKRAEADVDFISTDGPLIASLIQKAGATKERENQVISVNAYTNKQDQQELVAAFKMTLSVKSRKK